MGQGTAGQDREGCTRFATLDFGESTNIAIRTILMQTGRSAGLLAAWQLGSLAAWQLGSLAALASLAGLAGATASPAASRASETRGHQTCHLRKRATSAPAEGPAYGLDLANLCRLMQIQTDYGNGLNF